MLAFKITAFHDLDLQPNFCHYPPDDNHLFSGHFYLEQIKEHRNSPTAETLDALFRTIIMHLMDCTLFARLFRTSVSAEENHCSKEHDCLMLIVLCVH